MTIKNLVTITEEVLHEFGNRKTQGRMDLVCDVSSGNFYVVPKDIEHRDFIPQLGGIPEAFVPVKLGFSYDSGLPVIKSMLVGESGYEEVRGIRHSHAYLRKAFDYAMIFLNDQKDVILDLEKARISSTFAA